ncbi:hypothetical protein GA0115257_11573 [Streptomyces sp. LcepLS]|nr:hypothetical protein GA0115257_11573 [Streptomyces sp. LcepLS]
MSRKKKSPKHGHRLSGRSQQIVLTAGAKSARPPAGSPARISFAEKACSTCGTYLIRTRGSSWICEGCRIEAWAANKARLIERLQQQADPDARARLGEEQAKVRARRIAATKRLRASHLSPAEAGAAAATLRLIAALKLA